MSRLADAQARLDAALGRLDAALQGFEDFARNATDSRDRQIASLISELTTLRQERDALGAASELAAQRIDAVIERLQAQN